MNVMGVNSHIQEIGAFLHEKKPDVFVSTETKLRPGEAQSSSGRRTMRKILAGYKTFFSVVPSHGIKQPKGKGGVNVSLREDYATPGNFKRRDTPPELNGYICHTTIHTSSQTLTHIIGVYIPHDSEKRSAIYSYLGEVAEECRLSKGGLIMTGDWNAVLLPSDRTGELNANDRAHKDFCTTHNLVPMGGTENRAHTFRRLYASPVVSSRIDDTLCLRRQEDHQPSCNQSTYEAGGTLDHMALLTECPHAMLPMAAKPATRSGVTAATEVPTQPQGLRYPIKQDQLEATRARIAAETEPYHLTTTQAPVLKALNLLKLRLKGDSTAANIQRLRLSLAAEGAAPDVEALAEAVERNILISPEKDHPPPQPHIYPDD
jgi:exonuclease III